MVLYGSTVRGGMRSGSAVLVIAAVTLGACVNAPVAGHLGEATTHEPQILAVDSARPPQSATIRLEERSYVALLLVAPGHSATLLYPDSAADNQHGAGTRTLSYAIPGPLLRLDTLPRQPGDVRARAPTRPGMSAIPRDTRTYLLLVTSPQALVHSRLLEVTAGVSIPVVETEALNAVAKAVKSTIADEPRPWSGHYLQIGIFPLI